jgi:hypothetical protein
MNSIRDALDSIHTTTTHASRGMTGPPRNTNGGPSVRTSRLRNWIAARHVAK